MSGDAFTGSLTRPAGETVGAYAVLQGTLALNSNYTLSYVSANLTIGTAPLTITAANASRQYGQANPLFTGSVVGVLNGDGITAIFATLAGPASPVGGYAIVPTAVDPNNKLSNYALSLVNGTLTVTQAPLTVTAADAARHYGAPNPAFTGSITGILNSDNITATYSTTANQASPLGTYPITPTLVDPDSKLPNYSVTSNNGTLTISDALSIWSPSTVPTTIDVGPDAPVELGVKFKSDITGTIVGLRFYKSALNTGTHVGNLWDSAGHLLGTVTFTSETASGWQEADFATPVAVAANSVYVASYHTSAGHESAMDVSSPVRRGQSAAARAGERSLRQQRSLRLQREQCVPDGLDFRHELLGGRGDGEFHRDPDLDRGQSHQPHRKRRHSARIYGDGQLQRWQPAELNDGSDLGV